MTEKRLSSYAEITAIFELSADKKGFFSGLLGKVTGVIGDYFAKLRQDHSLKFIADAFKFIADIVTVRKSLGALGEKIFTQQQEAKEVILALQEKITKNSKFTISSQDFNKISASFIKDNEELDGYLLELEGRVKDLQDAKSQLYKLTFNQYEEYKGKEAQWLAEAYELLVKNGIALNEFEKPNLTNMAMVQDIDKQYQECNLELPPVPKGADPVSSKFFRHIYFIVYQHLARNMEKTTTAAAVMEALKPLIFTKIPREAAELLKKHQQDSQSIGAIITNADSKVAELQHKLATKYQEITRVSETYYLSSKTTTAPSMNGQNTFSTTPT